MGELRRLCPTRAIGAPISATSSQIPAGGMDELGVPITAIRRQRSQAAST
jgi:hypothetical protein